MLTPRLLECSDCENIERLIEEIDCKLVSVGNDAYNELIFALNNVCNDTKLFSLLTYRRILVARLANEIEVGDDYVYACDFSLEWIVSKVKLLTVGCIVKECCTVRTTVIAPVCLPFEITVVETI
jgi:hypothetical protein